MKSIWPRRGLQIRPPDQRLAEDGDAAGVLGAVAGGDRARAVGRLAERGHRGQVVLLGVACELEAGAEELRSSESVTISRMVSSSARLIGERSAWFQSSSPY